MALVRRREGDPVVAVAIEVVHTKRSQNGTTLTLKKLAKFLSNEREAICNSQFELTLTSDDLTL
ncbi:TPA: hypothetical protein ACH3X1_000666 [Trebouxia sp. C0004]